MDTFSNETTDAMMGLGFSAASGAIFGRANQLPSGQSFSKTILKRGALESVGFYQEAGINKGFLGLGKGYGASKAGASGAGSLGKSLGGKAFGMLARGVGIGYSAYSVYSGYQREGIWGAVKGGAETVAYSSAFFAGEMIAGSAAMTALGVFSGIAAAGAAYYAFGEAAQAHHKRLTGLEFGSPSIDILNSAGALTSRARAMNALHSTHINARIAIGNEALLGHTAYRP